MLPEDDSDMIIADPNFQPYGTDAVTRANIDSVQVMAR